MFPSKHRRYDVFHCQVRLPGLIIKTIPQYMMQRRATVDNVSLESGAIRTHGFFKKGPATEKLKRVLWNQCETMAWWLGIWGPNHWWLAVDSSKIPFIFLVKAACILLLKSSDLLGGKKNPKLRWGRSFSRCPRLIRRGYEWLVGLSHLYICIYIYMYI